MKTCRQMIPGEHTAVSVIPQPKEVQNGEGVFHLQNSCAILAGQELSEEAEFLSRRLADRFGFKLSLKEILDDSPRQGNIVMKLTKGKNSKDIGSEGYTLQVDMDGIRLEAPQPAGIFYGIQTLLQLIQAGDGQIFLPALEITDWPTLKLRGVHIDLKAQMPTFQYLKSILRRLAEYKINTVLLEYEDKFPYQSHPKIVSPLALSREQIKELNELAGSLHIEIIPLLQSLGHVEYILSHSEYAHLREVPNDFSQYCPLNPESQRLFKELAAEILELHPDGQFFHIGGDEADSLGQCPRCQAKAREIGKGVLYVEYINEICRFILNQGKRPVLWHDMLARNPEVVDHLVHDAVIMDWDYYSRDDEPFKIQIYDKGGGQILTKENLSEVSEKVRSVFEPYWKCEGYPDRFNLFGYTRFFKDRGFDVIAAPSVRVDGDSGYSPTFEFHLPNIRSFIEAAERYGALGVVATSWAVRRTPWETLWLGIAWTAEYAWSPERTDRQSFERKFLQQFYGAEDQTGIIEAKYLLSKLVATAIYRTPYNEQGHYWGWKPCYRSSAELKETGNFEKALKVGYEMVEQSERALAMLESAEPRVKRNRLSLQFYQWAARMIYHKSRLLVTWGLLDQAQKEKATQLLQSLLAEIPPLRDQMVRLFGQIMVPQEAEREQVLRFEGEQEEIKRLLGYLCRNSPHPDEAE